MTIIIRFLWQVHESPFYLEFFSYFFHTFWWRYFPNSNLEIFLSPTGIILGVLSFKKKECVMLFEIQYRKDKKKKFFINEAGRRNLFTSYAIHYPLNTWIEYAKQTKSILPFLDCLQKNLVGHKWKKKTTENKSHIVDESFLVIYTPCIHPFLKSPFENIQSLSLFLRFIFHNMQIPQRFLRSFFRKKCGDSGKNLWHIMYVFLPFYFWVLFIMFLLCCRVVLVPWRRRMVVCCAKK